MLYLDYAKKVGDGYILNFFCRQRTGFGIGFK